MLRGRALFIAGESYAGKYVPALADKLLRDPGMSSAEAACGGVSRGGHSAAVDAATARRPGVPRLLAAELLRRRAGVAASTGCLRSPRRGPRAPQQRDAQEDPPFVLSGLIIGSGFTDPIPQTRVLPAVAYSFGMVTESGRGELAAAAAVAVQLAEEGQWGAAAERRTALLQTLQNISGTATLLDVRRSEPYDAAGTVQTLLRTPAAAAVLRVPQQTAAAYESCSPVVAEAMESDVMRSVAHVFANALQRLPVLLYAGMFDAQDGVASTSAWLRCVWRWRACGVAWTYLFHPPLTFTASMLPTLPAALSPPAVCSPLF
jgi:Serine carboxypeptidase